MSSREAKVAVIGGHLRSDHLLQIISDQIIPVPPQIRGAGLPGADAQRVPVIIGRAPEGRRELVGLIDGVRENARSWRGLLLDLKTARACYGTRAGVAGGARGRSRTCAACKPRAVFGLPESAYRPAPMYTVGLVIGRVRLLSGRSHPWVDSPRLDAS